MGIVDKNGAWVVEYGYDAWGKPTWTIGSMMGTLGKLNPFRYRRYVYDEETGLYYLRSRYYDPSWGRFINADSRISNDKNILGANLYTYCENNPYNLIDSNGTSSKRPLVVMYDPKEFSRQAEDEATYLLNKYGGAEVEMVPIKRKAEYNAAWEGYKDSGAVMSLVFHGSDHHIWPGENFLLDDIKNLPKANLSVLRILIL